MMTKEEINSCNDSNALFTERLNLQETLKDMDYIGIKIATGRAKKSDYMEKIELMEECAENINLIDERIEELKSQEDETIKEEV